MAAMVGTITKERCHPASGWVEGSTTRPRWTTPSMTTVKQQNLTPRYIQASSLPDHDFPIHGSLLITTSLRAHPEDGSLQS
jgi:hypothetical protein